MRVLQSLSCRNTFRGSKPTIYRNKTIKSRSSEEAALVFTGLTYCKPLHTTCAVGNTLISHLKRAVWGSRVKDRAPRLLILCPQCPPQHYCSVITSAVIGDGGRHDCFGDFSGFFFFFKLIRNEAASCSKCCE